MMTGAQYLESLRDGRTVYIYGARVDDVTTHPAFRNTARMIARLYDALHDPETRDRLTVETDTGSGTRTHRCFRAARTQKELHEARDAAAIWSRLNYGWLGRSPDYKAGFLVTLGSNAPYYAPFEKNALRWYAEAQERVVFMNHAVRNPPVDRSQTDVRDVFMHVKKEVDAGIIVSGAKVVATTSALSNYHFIAHFGVPPTTQKEYAFCCIVPANAPGVKLIARTSYEMAATVMGSPFDYPLSSRLDENDSILIFEDVLVPWENVLAYGDCDKANDLFGGNGCYPFMMMQACTRFAVKLDFLFGLLLKGVKVVGSKDFRNVQAALGEVAAWRTAFWSLSDDMIAGASSFCDGYVTPSSMHASAYPVLANIAYPRIRGLIEDSLGSSLIYLPSHASDLKSAEVRPLLDRYVRGSEGVDAEERIKLMKLIWETVGTEFASRNDLYERFYTGGAEVSKVAAYAITSRAVGADCERLVERCLADYDVDGWRTKDLVDPGEFAFHASRRLK